MQTTQTIRSLVFFFKRTLYLSTFPNGKDRGSFYFTSNLLMVWLVFSLISTDHEPKGETEMNSSSLFEEKKQVRDALIIDRDAPTGA